MNVITDMLEEIAKPPTPTRPTPASEPPRPAPTPRSDAATENPRPSSRA